VSESESVAYDHLMRNAPERWGSGRASRAQQPIHVIHCADYAGPYPGSFVPMLAAAANEAQGRGYQTTVGLADEARNRPWLSELHDISEVRFFSVNQSRVAGIWPAIGELRSVLRASPNPTVIHTHFTTFDIPAALIRLRDPKVAVIWHEHTPLRGDPRAQLRNTLRYACLGSLVSQILCVSPELRTTLLSRRAPGRKLLDFPNAIDLRRFSRVSPSERALARRSLGLPKHARVVLHFGWNWQVKGGDLMLAAAEDLATDPDLVVLTVIGENAADDGVPALEGNPIVRALGPTNDVNRLYAAADVFLSCSRAEGMPFAVLEALACGLPVVATDLPVQRDLLAGLPGAATVASEPSSIAAGVREMLSLNPGARIEHAEASRARIGSSFALEPWARRLVDLYEGALGAGGSARASG
jgi:glycosyltransferase involved in cell wall biosynthesis